MLQTVGPKRPIFSQCGILRAGLAAAILVIMIVAGGCSSEAPTEDEPPVSSIVPLVAGNKWVFDFISYHPDGSILSTRQDSIVIMRDTTVDYEQWYLNQIGTLMRNQSEGLWTMIEPNPPRLLYKYPASSGDSYTFGNVDSTQFLITVMSTDELVILPVGTFNCMKYRQVLNGIGATDTTMIFVAPDTGLVQKIVTSSSGVLRARLVLKAYSLQ